MKTASYGFDAVTTITQECTGVFQICTLVVGTQSELQNVKYFTQIQIEAQNFTPKMRESRLICFCDKIRKSSGLCAHNEVQPVPSKVPVQRGFP